MSDDIGPDELEASLRYLRSVMDELRDRDRAALPSQAAAIIRAIADTVRDALAAATSELLGDAATEAEGKPH